MKKTFRILALDFGLSNLDAVLLESNQENIKILAQQQIINNSSRSNQQPETNFAVLEKLLHQYKSFDAKPIDAIATTGGRHKELPKTIAGISVQAVSEAVAIGRGGLHLANLKQALVVSAGTGTAMIASNTNTKSFLHQSGSAVGGGTLLGLARLLLGTTDVEELGALAARGNAANIDSTLQDAIGGGIGHLPANATAVNFGLVAKLNPGEPLTSKDFAAEDLAAALVTLVAQVIGVIALNTAQSSHQENIVVIGRLLQMPTMRQRLEDVWDFYGVSAKPIVPKNAALATALGAGLAVLTES